MYRRDLITRHRQTFHQRIRRPGLNRDPGRGRRLSLPSRYIPKCMNLEAGPPADAALFPEFQFLQ
jgi:hypothetical protein